MFKFLLAASVAGHLFGFGVSTDTFASRAKCEAVLPAKMHVMRSVTEQGIRAHGMSGAVKVFGKCAPAADVDKAAAALKVAPGMSPVKKPGYEI